MDKNGNLGTNSVKDANLSNSSSSASITDEPKNLWMVKPCEWYKEEYKDCKSFQARFHQYFVDGETADCSGWKQDYDNCLKWGESKDKDAVNQVIENEKIRIKQRLVGHYANDIWERRKEPLPESVWSPPLPEHIEKGYENSFLKEKAEGLRKGDETMGDVDENLKEFNLFDKESDNYCSIV